MQQAFIVPKQQDGLSVRVGTDGVWLEFKSTSGRSWLMNMSSMSNTPGFNLFIAGWVDDMEALAREAARPNEFDASKSVVSQCDCMAVGPDNCLEHGRRR